MKQPNGAGYSPETEDVPRDFYEEEMTRGYKNFEDYLKMQYEKETKTLFSFDRWVYLTLDSEAIMLYADAYGELKKEEGFNMAGNIYQN